MATVTIVGATAALFAALIAFVQTDIKKVLAYSTVSQLGFMFIGVGAGVWWAGVLHLVTHAFFKGCLFLGAGSGDAGWGRDGHPQDGRAPEEDAAHRALTFGISTSPSPASSALRLVQKDAILGGAVFGHNPAWHQVGQIAYVIGVLAALGTAFYMSRLFFLTFVGSPDACRRARARCRRS